MSSSSGDNKVTNAASGGNRSPLRTKRGAVVHEKKLKVKLTPELLRSPAGFQRLGELAATLQLSTVKGHEAANALAILELFDNWAQELCPSYDPEDFFDKVEKMGKTRIVREVLNDLLGITATDIERRKRRKKDDAEGTASKDNSNEAEPIVASSSEVGNSSVNLEHFTSSLNSDYIEPPDVRGAASQAVQV